MFLLGGLFLVASALAQPTVYIARSSVAYPSYRMYFSETVPEIAIIKKPETKVVLDTEVVPEAPVLEPLPVVKSVELEADEPKEDIEEKKEEIEEMKKEEIEEKKEEDIEEKKEEEIENTSEEERKEEILKEEGPKKEESEEDKKDGLKLELPKPPKFITSFISALPIKFPSFELPFDLGSLWKPKAKEIRLVPAYNLREWKTLI